MRLRITPQFFLLASTIWSCGQGDREEKARQYYSSVAEIIEPYVLGTEKLLKTTREIMQQTITSTGKARLSVNDSVKIAGHFAAFELLTNNSKSKLYRLKEFEDFDLKQPTQEFINETSRIILQSYKPIIFHFQNRTEGQKDLKSLITDIMNGIEKANERYTNTQSQFLKEYGIPKIN